MQTLPVAYLLVRDLATNPAGKEKMRTKLEAGYINNQTKHIITQNNAWKIGCIVGPFRTMEIALAFVKLWSGDTTTAKTKNGKSKAARGPIMRISRGIALACLFELSRWIDPDALSRSPAKFYNIVLTDNSLVACERELTPSPDENE